MNTETKNEKSVVLDQDGHLANREDWNKELAQDLADHENIGELTGRHWDVINYIRDEYDKKGDAPSIRKLTKESGVSTKELYKLFPKGPAKKAAKVAGLPKPKGCI
jgi:tRNA 2-thiouridine synthesizing protein E